MKYLILSLILIASVSLIVSVPDSFAQVEKGYNYDKELIQTFPDGSKQIKFTTHYPRLLDNAIYKDYIFTETANNLTIETAIGSVSLDKNSCGFNFHSNGFIADNPIPLFSDSIVAFNSIVDLYSWNAVTQVNSATCEAYFDQGNTSLVAKRYASGVGFMEYKYIFSNGLWKTQLEATNLTTLTNRVFAFDQTIDLNRDTINYGGERKNLDTYSGQTFARAWLESGNNQDKLINLLNGIYFDFDKGFENLDSITVTDTGINKSKLTFHYMRNNDLLLPNETLIIDPTFVGTSSYDVTVYDNGDDQICNGDSPQKAEQAFAYISTQADVATEDCTFGFFIFDISSIPPGSSVSDVYFTFDTTGGTGGTPRNCDYVSAGNISSSTSATDTFSAILTPSAVFVTNDSQCATSGTSKSVDLGSVGDSTFESQLSFESFTLGVKPTSITIDTTLHQTGIKTGSGTPDPTLTVLYTLPPYPYAVDDLTLDSSTWTTADLSYTLPYLNGESFITYMLNFTTPQESPVTVFNQNTTSTSISLTGLTPGTSYSAQVSVYTIAGGNWTTPASLVLNFTTSLHSPPGTPTLSASALSESALRYTSVTGTAGSNSTIWYGLQCNLNSAGYTSIVSNSSYVSFYEYTGLTFGDVNICQWRDGSVDGWSGWSNNATDTLNLAILSTQRGTTDPDDHLMAFIEMVSGFGGVYFGLGVVPFGIMLIGFMAGKKTVRIFTLATLMLMGIVHASGYYVFPDWYWTLCLLFGLVLIMGRMKSD